MSLKAVGGAERKGLGERCAMTLPSQSAVSACPAREGQAWGQLSAEPPQGPGHTLLCCVMSLSPGIASTEPSSPAELPSAL